ncbi:MAG: ABC transporter substrate-binding protein [Pseudomonadota bacterium]
MIRSLGTLASAIALAMFAAPPAEAADDKLVITSHAVHQRVLTDGEGGDIVKDWQEKTGAEVEFLTFGVSEAQERAFREASLSAGNVDVSFILGRYGGPQIAALFTDLGEMQDKQPIEDIDEISPGMRAAHTHDGKLIGIPFRHATHGLHYNQAILAEQGIETPPTTFNEIIDYARELTFTRDDGTKVHGMVISMDVVGGVSMPCSARIA